MNIRIGFGYDSHRTDPERKLVLGGVNIPNCPGLAGHSDADVLLHSIIDAILSASGQADIGQKFPNTDERYRDISSIELLKQSLPKNWEIVQIDSTIVCDQPKIQLYKDSMIDKIKTVLGPLVQVTIKGKTSEGLGYVGRGEGIVSFAVVLIQKS
ncbi:MAG: 2-C-methyl-D-erythritol 2,4-cyclodiphosphate synthase [Candidatus Lindowbacteria bacterium]|nr:2-C-methyl-D-erythritol 2,4-cyclodiphosphate synthase [Candidatus Lindowbacteria bacterium]